jgi:hypothetical protein
VYGFLPYVNNGPLTVKLPHHRRRPKTVVSMPAAGILAQIKKEEI